MTIFESMDKLFASLNRVETSSSRCRITKEMLHLFLEHEELQQAWSYDETKRLIVDRWVKITPKKPATSTRRKTINLSETVLSWGGTEIHFLNNCQNKDTPSGEKTYLFKFYTDNEIIFSKIGTTARNCLKRLKDEIRYYTKRDFNITKVEICEIIDCQEMPAESFESYLRALLIKKFPNTWKKNDRFFGVNIPVEIFIKLCAEFAAR